MNLVTNLNPLAEELRILLIRMDFGDDAVVENLPASAGDTGVVGSVPGLGTLQEDEMATHSSILAWRIPWTEKPGRLLSIVFAKS